MAGDTGGTFVALIGFFIIIDSFVTVQSFVTGVSFTTVNFFELLLGLITLFLGLWQRGMLTRRK